MKRGFRPSRLVLPLILVVSFLVLLGIAYRPDRPVAPITPGTSAGPEFIVQIVRPRGGLPLGGLLPPQLFGQDAKLGFDSSSDGATVVGVGPGGLELSAADWELVVVVDDDGNVSDETEVVFELIFQEQVRRVRCRPAGPAVGSFTTTHTAGSDELSGRFHIELPHCEDAETGKPLGWPPAPLVLHGSFDRLRLEDAK